MRLRQRTTRIAAACSSACTFSSRTRCGGSWRTPAVAEAASTHCGIGYLASHMHALREPTGVVTVRQSTGLLDSTSSLVRVSGAAPMTSSAQLDRSVRRYSSMYLRSRTVAAVLWQPRCGSRAGRYDVAHCGPVLHREDHNGTATHSRHNVRIMLCGSLSGLAAKSPQSHSTIESERSAHVEPRLASPCLALL